MPLQFFWKPITEETGKASNHGSELSVSHDSRGLIFSPILRPFLIHYPYQAQVEESNHTAWDQEFNV